MTRVAAAAGPRRSAGRLPGRRVAAVALLGLAALLPLQRALAQTPAPAPAQGPAGLWETISDVDGKPKGHVRIREIDGELRGTIEAILDPAKRDKSCDKCADQRHNQPVLGLTILEGMRADGDHYSGGHILDPDNGSVYSCRIKVVDGGRKLEVRGFIGISLLGRTQTWNRLE